MHNAADSVRTGAAGCAEDGPAQPMHRPVHPVAAFPQTATAGGTEEGLALPMDRPLHDTASSLQTGPAGGAGAPVTVGAWLRHAALLLRHHGESPRLDAELLLGSVLGLSRAALLVRSADPLGAAAEHAALQLLERRLQGAPVAYLTGIREFWSLELMVTPDVLVPRPETELLVELALDLLPRDVPLSVLDLGTGSGAIALALASERPLAQVTGTDVSEAALAVAAANSRKLGLTQIQWCTGSWFEAVSGRRFDLIVANPPYVAADDPALRSLAAEPALALSCGPTGLEAFDSIVDGAAAHLSPGGWLLFEHGDTQAAEVARRLERRGFSRIRSHADYSGKIRVTLGTLQPSF